MYHQKANAKEFNEFIFCILMIIHPISRVVFIILFVWKMVDGLS